MSIVSVRGMLVNKLSTSKDMRKVLLVMLMDCSSLTKEKESLVVKRLLRKLKKKQSLDNKTYYDIFPKGSQPARFYGLPKLHKHRDIHESPPLRPIISSVKVARYSFGKLVIFGMN